MCGIAGEMRFDGGVPSALVLERMAENMARRGPNGHGLVRFGVGGFVHRRLSIFDLSDRAQQPMQDAELGLTLVFNGAIYNFRELRAELEGKGYRFFSNSDTEVILKAWHAWGEACVRRFNGMFAFTIHERDTGRLALVRDRLGIKPLYYTADSGSVRFASTLPALLAAGDTDTRISDVALHYYLMFHAVPEPLTILQGARKVPPATVLTFEANGRRSERVYWQWQVGGEAEKSRPEEEWYEAFTEVLTRAVSRRAVADVPVGLLLSGGLDSSVLAALLARTTNSSLRTFSIGFASTKEEEGDEFRYSDLVARQFGTEHQRIRVTDHDVLDSLDACIEAMSEPMTSHDNVAFYLLSREVSQSVPVVQSGQGADELLAGYRWFQECGRSKTTSASVQAYASKLLDRSYAEYQRTVTKAFQTENLALPLINAHFNENASSLLAENALRLDAGFPLSEGPLKRVDNMTMAWSLEARVPFLDHEMAEFAARVPLSLKLKDGGKYLLKRFGRALLPKEVVDRPKGYFPVPGLKYLDGPFLERVRESLSDERIKTRGLFRPDYVRHLFADPKRHLTPLGGSKLWQLAVLEDWLRLHRIG